MDPRQTFTRNLRYMWSTSAFNFFPDDTSHHFVWRVADSVGSVLSSLSSVYSLQLQMVGDGRAVDTPRSRLADTVTSNRFTSLVASLSFYHPTGQSNSEILDTLGLKSLDKTICN